MNHGTENHPMAQLFVPELDDAVGDRLKQRARRNGRSIEAEACAILAEALRDERRDQGLSEEGIAMPLEEKGFGDLMYERFKDIGLKGDEVRRFSMGIAAANSRWAMGLPDFEGDEYEESPEKK
jgi:plasmid stability protein